MKTRIQSLTFLATLAIVFGLLSWGSTLHAQTTPSSTPTDQQTQQPQQPSTPDNSAAPQKQTPDTPPATQQPPAQQSPDAQSPDMKSPTSAAASPTASDSKTFMGTVVKSGDKYMLQEDSGKTYDIDHQDDVKKFEGKRVKVQGKLDETGTRILVK